MIEKLSGRVAYSVMSFGGFLGMGSPVEQAHVRYLSGRRSYRCDGKSTMWDLDRSELRKAAAGRAPYYWGRQQI